MLEILIYLCLALIAVSLAMMLGFGVKNAGRIGDESKLGLVAIALPLLLFAVSFVIAGGWIGAGVWTALLMALASVLALLASGARTFFT